MFIGSSQTRRSRSKVIGGLSERQRKRAAASAPLACERINAQRKHFFRGESKSALAVSGTPRHSWPGRLRQIIALRRRGRRNGGAFGQEQDESTGSQHHGDGWLGTV